MIALIQRVSQARVDINGYTKGAIDKGLLVLLGVERGDDEEKAKRLCQKILNYRIFSDGEGKMNLNLQQVNGQILLVSQFTLAADTSKGHRPGFSRAGDPQTSEQLYHYVTEQIQQQGIVCQTGEFGADMQVSLTNDGPVTFQLQVQ